MCFTPTFKINYMTKTWQIKINSMTELGSLVEDDNTFEIYLPILAVKFP